MMQVESTLSTYTPVFCAAQHALVQDFQLVDAPFGKTHIKQVVMSWSPVLHCHDLVPIAHTYTTARYNINSAWSKHVSQPSKEEERYAASHVSNLSTRRWLGGSDCHMSKHDDDIVHKTIAMAHDNPTPIVKYVINALSFTLEGRATKK